MGKKRRQGFSWAYQNPSLPFEMMRPARVYSSVASFEFPTDIYLLIVHHGTAVIGGGGKSKLVYPSWGELNAGYGNFKSLSTSHVLSSFHASIMFPCLFVRPATYPITASVSPSLRALSCSVGRISSSPVFQVCLRCYFEVPSSQSYWIPFSK